jgi:hypothetical protein
MPEILRFDSEREGRIVTAVLSTVALRPTWSVGWVLGAFYVEVKWLGHEADRTLPSAAEVKNELSNTSPPSCPFITCTVTAVKTCLKYGEQF